MGDESYIFAYCYGRKITFLFTIIFLVSRLSHFALPLEVKATGAASAMQCKSNCNDFLCKHLNEHISKGKLIQFNKAFATLFLKHHYETHIMCIY